jgi:hypothetical protein
MPPPLSLPLKFLGARARLSLTVHLHRNNKTVARRRRRRRTVERRRRRRRRRSPLSRVRGVLVLLGILVGEREEEASLSRRRRRSPPSRSRTLSARSLCKHQ